jgi:hypothetical protein
MTTPKLSGVLAFQSARRADVIDLARYRASRARQEDPDQAELPLFARPLRGAPATVTPFRRLTERDVAHRARMLAHLSGLRR